MYKAKASGWRGHDTVSLEISVGKDYHEGEKLAATIDWVNRCGFKHCIIGVADTLQRHNHADKPNPHEFSLQQGDAWIRRNRRHLQQIRPPWRIIRWDQWLKHPEFITAQQTIQHRLMRETNLREAVQQDLERYLQRNPHRCPQTCLDYLLEELAVQMLIDKSLDLLMAYPGARNRSASIVATSGFAKINFHKRPASKYPLGHQVTSRAHSQNAHSSQISF